jgi:hypothetical protein
MKSEGREEEEGGRKGEQAESTKLHSKELG